MAVMIPISAVLTVLSSVQRGSRCLVAYICLNSCPAGSHAKSYTPPAQTCSDPVRVTERERKSGRDVGGLQEADGGGGAREETQVEERGNDCQPACSQ